MWLNAFLNGYNVVPTYMSFSGKGPPCGLGTHTSPGGFLLFALSVVKWLSVCEQKKAQRCENTLSHEPKGGHLMATPSVTPPTEDIQILQPHPLSLRFGDKPDAEYQSLKASLAADGQHDSITLHDGMILDGRHRYRACLELGLKPHFRPLPAGVDPLRFVIAQNVIHRNYTTSQRALMAAEMVTAKQGRPEKTPIGVFMGVDEASELWAVSPRQVDRARYVARHGDEALIRRVRDGDLRLGAAEKIVSEAVRAAEQLAQSLSENQAVAMDVEEEAAEIESTALAYVERGMPVAAAAQRAVDKAVKKAVRTAAQAERGEREEETEKKVKTLDELAEERGGTWAKEDEPVQLATDYEEIPFYGDALLLDSLPRECSDLIVTSPPYNVGKAWSESSDDRMPYEEYLAFSTQWLKNAYHWTKRTGRMCVNAPLDTNIFGKRPVYADLTRIALDVGWRYHATIIWNEGNISKRTAWGSWLSPSAPSIISPVETIIVFYKEEWKRERQGETELVKEDDLQFMNWVGDVWTFSGENAKRIGHPAPFPSELPRRCIKLLSFPGDTVLDPFAGSGTTLIESLALNRQPLGIELDHNYCRLIEKRLLSVYGDRVAIKKDGSQWLVCLLDTDQEIKNAE